MDSVCESWWCPLQTGFTVIDFHSIHKVRKVNTYSRRNERDKVVIT